MTQSVRSNMSKPERQCGGRGAPYLPDGPLTDMDRVNFGVYGLDVTEVVQGVELKCGSGTKVWLAKFVDVSSPQLMCPECHMILNSPGQLREHFSKKRCK